MDPGWLSNAYLVADEPGGTAVFVDSGAPLEPLLRRVEEWRVTPTHVLRTHAGGVGSKSILPHRPVRRANLQSQSRSRLGHTLPRIAGEFRLFVRSKFVRKPADNAARVEALRRDHNGFKDIGRRHHQK